MKKIAFIVGGLVLLALVVVLGLASLQPDEFTVTRSIDVGSAPARAFEQVNDFHRWSAWSPWEKLDPGMQRTHSGATSGRGAIYEWRGNPEVGKGRMEIVESLSASKVVIDLHFMEPFEAKNVTTFSFAPDAGGTEVNWSMKGKNTFISKIMCVFMDMDSMIGADFESGLSQLKTVAEGSVVP